MEDNGLIHAFILDATVEAVNCVGMRLTAGRLAKGYYGYTFLKHQQMFHAGITKTVDLNQC